MHFDAVVAMRFRFPQKDDDSARAFREAAHALAAHNEISDAKRFVLVLQRDDFARDVFGFDLDTSRHRERRFAIHVFLLLFPVFTRPAFLIVQSGNPSV